MFVQLLSCFDLSNILTDSFQPIYDCDSFGGLSQYLVNINGFNAQPYQTYYDCDSFGGLSQYLVNINGFNAQPYQTYYDWSTSNLLTCMNGVVFIDRNGVAQLLRSKNHTNLIKFYWDINDPTNFGNIIRYTIAMNELSDIPIQFPQALISTIYETRLSEIEIISVNSNISPFYK